MITSAPGLIAPHPRAGRDVSARKVFWRESARATPRRYLRIKRLIDVSVSVALLLVGAPIFALIAAAIKIVSPGPAFFRKGGSARTVTYSNSSKFRTMIDGAHRLHEHVAHLNELDGPMLKIANDPRLHPLGAFLRRSSLDGYRSCGTSCAVT